MGVKEEEEDVNSSLTSVANLNTSLSLKRFIVELNTALPATDFFCLRIFHVADRSSVSDEYVEERLLLRLNGGKK